MMLLRALAVIGVLALAAPAQAQDLRGLEAENVLFMDLTSGRVVIRMFPSIAPRHVARIRALVREGFYDGLTFHRVIDGFMAQTGDPSGTGRGGSGVTIPAEFSDRAKHVRGAVSMARRPNDIDSADSQFFILLDDAPWLDGQFTIWGEVTEGMDLVDQIKRGDPNRNGLVTKPDRILRIQVASDVVGVSTGSAE